MTEKPAWLAGLAQLWNGAGSWGRVAIVTAPVVVLSALIAMVSLAAGDGAPSGRTGDQGDLFVQQLKRNQYISIDEGAAVDMAKTACNAPLQGAGLYNAQQAMQQRHPEYDLNIVATVMAQGVLMYCPDRLG